jgi:hypothetical protein
MVMDCHNEVYRRHCVYSVWNLDPLEAVLGFLMMI